MNLKLQTAHLHQPKAQGSTTPYIVCIVQLALDRTSPPSGYSPHRSPLQFTEY